MKLAYANTAPYWAVGLMMAFHFLFGAIVVERMAGIGFGGHTAFFAYRALSLVVLAVFALYLARNTGLVGLPPFAWFLAFLLLLGLAVGLLFGREPSGMFPHAVQALAALVGFCAGYLFMRERLDLWSVLKITSYATLVAVVFWLSVYSVAVWMSGAEIPHYSLNFYALIIPFAYFLASRNGIGALFTFALMVLVGKRAIMLAGVVMALSCYVEALRFDRSRKPPKIWKWQWLAIVAVGAAPVAWGFLARLASLPAPPHEDAVAANTIEAPDILGRYSNVTDLNALSSFRGDLIDSVVLMLNSSPIQWITGAGFGSSFVFAYQDNAAITSGVDLMPLHLVMLYGIPATVAVFLFIGWLLLRGWGVVHHSHGAPQKRLMTAIMAILVGYLVCSMFTYVSIDPVFWFLLGACWWLVSEPEKQAAQ